MVYCHFPDRNRFPSIANLEDLIPYNDPHYCMVLAILNKQNSIIVVYGTSQINEISKYDFILENQYKKETNLVKKTKWSFTPSNIAILPYNKVYFSCKPNNILPKVGSFPESKKMNYHNYSLMIKYKIFYMI